LVANSSASRSVSVIVGNGLTPLLSNNRKCDAIVTAGMGTNRLLQILSNSPSKDLYGEIEEQFGRTDSDSNPVYYDYIRPRVLDLSHLDLLGVKRIITQPWPPNILPVHALHSALLDNGWQFEDQGIDVTSNHHLTTCFTRSPQVLHSTVLYYTPLLYLLLFCIFCFAFLNVFSYSFPRLYFILCINSTVLYCI
jgi:tRNA (adenine(22)-N(1))-methyltransferase